MVTNDLTTFSYISLRSCQVDVAVLQAAIMKHIKIRLIQGHSGLVTRLGIRALGLSEILTLLKSIARADLLILMGLGLCPQSLISNIAVELIYAFNCIGERWEEKGTDLFALGESRSFSKMI